MMETEDNFKEEFENLKKETHKKFTDLFSRFPNARSWKIDFEYDWCVGCSSSIDEDFSGWSKEDVESEESA